MQLNREPRRRGSNRSPRRAAAIVVIMLAAMLLAGCSDNGARRHKEVVVESNIFNVASNETGNAGYEPSARTMGHIAGIVVDQAIRPLEGIAVRLPGLDAQGVTDRNGAFGFVDLHPGPYYITAESPGFAKAETELMVEADTFTRVKFILRAIPPPTPRHFTLPFEGFAEVTDQEQTGGGLMCSVCSWDFYVEGDGFRGLIVEATMDAPSPPAVSNSFYYELQDDEGADVSRDYSTNPMRLVLRMADTETSPRYHLGVQPLGFPAPEVAKKFHIYVTQWFNEDPPQDWSFVSGSQ